MTHELVTAATGAGSNGFIYPNAMNIVLGTRFKIVLGYKSSPEADLAMERGEAQARAGFSLSAILQEHPGWIADKKVAVLVQAGAEREKDFPDVPLKAKPPLLFLVAPGFRFHSTIDIVLRYLSPEIEVARIALAENWRGGLHVIFRQ